MHTDRLIILFLLLLLLILFRKTSWQSRLRSNDPWISSITAGDTPAFPQPQSCDWSKGFACGAAKYDVIVGTKCSNKTDCLQVSVMNGCLMPFKAHTYRLWLCG